MIFSSFSEVVDKPCDQLLTYPYQCFREKFFSLPQELLRSLAHLLGLAVVLCAWAIILVFIAATIYFFAQKFFKLTRYFFNDTKVGHKIAALVPLHKLLCCSSGNGQDQDSKKFHGVFGDYGSSLVSKVHEAKWIKGVLKKRSFAKNDDADVHSPAKSAQKLACKLSLSPPKLLSPKIKN